MRTTTKRMPPETHRRTFIRATIARVVQLNAEQPFAYDRDALVKMLGEELQKKK